MNKPMKLKYNYLLFFIFYSLLIIGFTWSQDCTAGDCIEGYGNYIYEDGSKYMGMFNERKKNGEGIYIYPDGGK